MKKLALALALLAAPFAAIAEDKAPACTSQTVGQLHCMAQKQCECKFFPKSAMAGTPDRFSWDCGINRGPCLDYQNIESSKPYDGPDSVYIDRGNTISGTINN